MLIRPLLSDPAGRLEDLTLDALGRLHAVVFSPSRSGVIVQDQGVLCQTVNVLDATYPFQDATGQPSVSTRAVAALGDGIWLLGSDAGVGQVTDGFQEGQCPVTGVEVHYGPILRREDGQLPANTVPALEVSENGALWIGSVLGLGRLQDGELSRVPFDAALSFQGDAATLEAFFQEVAQAIFEARPVESVALGDVSFVEAFGSALVKEDLIFSLAEDAQGHLWVGTLGGGVRRVETRNGTVEQTLHLTRLDGLASNIVFSLAVGPDGSIWAATDDGVSRIESNGADVAITTFTSLDGLVLPARDIAVDRDGTAWVATDGGLFRIQARSGQLTGVVQDTAGQPVQGATILIHGTSAQTVTDAQGWFRVGGMAPGTYLLQADGRQANTGAFAPAFREVTVQVGMQELSPLVLEPMAPPRPVDVAQGGVVTFPEVPGAALDIAPQTAQFPEGAAAAIGLTLLPLPALPRPLPSGFTGIIAAEIDSPGLSFTAPARLTLPTVGQLSS
jgi:hypothetical protein